MDVSQIKQITHGQNYVRLERKCPLCGKVQFLYMLLSRFEAIKKAPYISPKTLPFTLSAKQREFFITGMCDFCWDETVKYPSADV